VKTNLRGKILRMNGNGSIPKDNPFGTRIWSFGHRNSFGFTFDPKTGRLWETENGPECNDEINLIVKGGNFGWGPNENCNGTAPQDTNNSGPKPRHLPKTYFQSPIAITGAAFCIGCGLGASVNGDLVFGDWNTGSIRAVNLNATRRGFSAAQRILIGTGSNGRHVDRDGAEPPHLLQRAERDLPARRRLNATFGGSRVRKRSGTLLVRGERPSPDGCSQGGLAVNIGRPKRIIEIEPATVPLPEPQMPMPEPGPAPVEPMPLELPVEPPGP
jgi:hypothetical protein